MILKRILFIGCIVVLLSSFANEDGRTRYFLKPTVPLDMNLVKAVEILMEGDTIRDTLYQVLSKNQLPVAYYQPVTRSVCFDNKCRILKVNIYWNITGRYLGFELPKGEFLSKAEHEPFLPPEYLELNRLLADSLSLLKDVKLSDMIPKTQVTGLGIDGVTSPTTGAVAEYVVKGAGYTTYAMWHLIYGEGQKKVTELTEKALNDTLLLQIMDSEDAWDKQWAIRRLPTDKPLSPQLEQRLLSNINDPDFSLAQLAIKSLKPVHLGSVNLQNGLFGRFKSVGYALKNDIVVKLLEAQNLHPELSADLAEQLSQANGELFINILSLFKKHRVYTGQVLRVVKGLVNSPNRFISNKAAEFLKYSHTKN